MRVGGCSVVIVSGKNTSSSQENMVQFLVGCSKTAPVSLCLIVEAAVTMKMPFNPLYAS